MWKCKECGCEIIGSTTIVLPIDIQNKDIDKRGRISKSKRRRIMHELKEETCKTLDNYYCSSTKCKNHYVNRKISTDYICEIVEKIAKWED